MKKFLWFFIVLFFAALFFFGYQKRGRAEETVSPTANPYDVTPPDWLTTATFDPYVTPVPAATAEPAAGGLRDGDTQEDVSRTRVYSIATSAYWAGSPNARVIYYRYMTGTSQGGSTWPITNRAGINSNQANYDEDDEWESFMTYTEFSSSYSSFYNSAAISMNNGAFLYSIKEYPQVDLTRGYSITYTLGSGSIVPSFGAVSSFPEAFTALGYSDSTLYDALEVSISGIVHYSDGTEAAFTQPLISWAYFDSGYTFEVKFNPVDRFTRVTYVSINIVVSPSFRIPVLYNELNAYFEAHPDITPNYGNWYLSGTGSFKMSRRVDLTEEEYNRAWYQNFIMGAIVPRTEVLQQIIDEAGIMPTSGVGTFVLSFRDLILENTQVAQNRDFYITIPAFHPTIGGVTYNFWDQYSFNWTSVLNISSLGSGSGSGRTWTIKSLINVFFDFLFASAFANSMIALVVGFYDLHLWQGVSGGGEED